MFNLLEANNCFQELVKSTQTKDMPMKIKALMDSLRHNFWPASSLAFVVIIRELGLTGIFQILFMTHSKKYILYCYPSCTHVTETKVTENSI